MMCYQQRRWGVGRQWLQGDGVGVPGRRARQHAARQGEPRRDLLAVGTQQMYVLYLKLSLHMNSNLAWNSFKRRCDKIYIPTHKLRSGIAQAEFTARLYTTFRHWSSGTAPVWSSHFYGGRMELYNLLVMLI